MKKQAKKNKRRVIQSKSDDEIKCEILIDGHCPFGYDLVPVEEILMEKEYGCKFGCPGCYLLRGSFQQRTCQEDKEWVKRKQEVWQTTKDLVKTLKTGMQEVNNDLEYRIITKDTLRMLARQHICR